MKPRLAWFKQLLRLLSLLLVCTVALQIVFAARIALMAVLAPQSTAFQRSEAWRLLVDKQQVSWSQQWVDRERIGAHLQRAVIASEDAGFNDHGGVDWAAVEKAWGRNQQAEARAERAAARTAARTAARAAAQTAVQTAGQTAAPRPTLAPVPKVVGGSTITQQLAKNLFLSGERTVLRKAQELLLTLMLETLLSKERILEIYLNNVEWGEGVFGAQAAAQHYFRIDPARLGPEQAARLAVMLPAPKRFEKRPGSPYVSGRAATIAARMGGIALP
ncbi:MAG: transglycosylase domain-containing protein [Rubrivivax sp.]|nr:transglycosylase domain-containing protein [Rubrivivax sp.]